MNDPRTEAAQTVESLLTRARREPLSAADCQRALAAVPLVPGRVRHLAHALSAQRDAASVAALLQLPPHVPGVVEGLHGAITAGVSRARRDGSPCPHLLAIDFRRSRARTFSSLLTRARQVFGSDYERLDVGGEPRFRVGVHTGRGTMAGQVAAKAQDIQWLHGRLGKLKGTRLWINGWTFAVDGAWRAPIQVHLVRAWLGWAATQTQTRR
ncbi:MAG: hypothetical protein K0V04_42630 [Deltaproteobacteria bacterium]|nr:hypothetical protein [Deltaproteobacteria bacterium]